MVLPAPAPLDAHAPAELEQRLRLILRLGEAGVLVLVDRARREQLGRFVRMMLRIEPRLEVLTSALGFVRVEPGSVIVLLPNTAEAAWMNQERPILAHRRLRVLMWSDEQTSGEIARRAPDFFHWTSHLLEAPKGAYPPSVLGLRAAARHEAPIAWLGGDFEEAFGEAFGADVSFVRFSAARPFVEIVECLRNEERWVVVTDVEDSFRLRRLRWAIGESGRKGRVVLLEPKAEPDGFARVHANPMDPREAEKRLAGAGAKHPGRLVAILDGEAEAVDLAAELLAKGIAEAEVEGVWTQEDPGAAVVELAERNGVAVAEAAPCRSRFANPGAGTGGIDPLEAAREATKSEDWEVAESLARRVVAERQGVKQRLALLFLARALAGRGALEEAQAHAEEVIKGSKGTSKENIVLRLLALQLLGRIQDMRKDLKGARQSIEAALHVAKRLDEQEREELLPGLLQHLSSVLRAQGDLNGARSAAEKALRMIAKVSGSDHDPTAAEYTFRMGMIDLERGDYAEALKKFEAASTMHRALYGEVHRAVANDYVYMATAALKMADFPSAERSARSAIDISRKIGPRGLADPLFLLGHILQRRGDLDEAISVLTEASSLAPATEVPEGTQEVVQEGRTRILLDLALALTAKGRMEEASKTIDEAVHLLLGDDANDEQQRAAFVSFVWLLLGSVPASMDQQETALRFVREGHDHLLRKLGPDHELTQRAAALLSRLPPDLAARPSEEDPPPTPT